MAAAHEDLQGRIQNLAGNLFHDGQKASQKLGGGTLKVERVGTTTFTQPTLTDAVNRLNKGDEKTAFVLSGVLYNVTYH